MQVMTLYSSYDEYNIDMDILGKVVSIPQLNRDELKEIVFNELQETHPIPKLEDERYKLSRPVDEDYKIQVENYIQQFEDEDLSVDELGEDEDPYNQGTDEEDIYSIGDIYGLDINIFSSPLTEDEVEQATKDIESFLSKKVRRFKQNKAEYEKQTEVSLEELRAMYQTKVHIPEESITSEPEEEVMEDTLSSEEIVPSEKPEVEEIDSTDDYYFISEPDIPFIQVLKYFKPEPSVPYIIVKNRVQENIQSISFIQEPTIPYIQVTSSTPISTDIDAQSDVVENISFIQESLISYIQVFKGTPDTVNTEIQSDIEDSGFIQEPSIPYIVVLTSGYESKSEGTASEENSNFFVKEPNISFINVYSSQVQENQGYSEDGDDGFEYDSDEEEIEPYDESDDYEDYDEEDSEEVEDESEEEEDDSLDDYEDSADFETEDASEDDDEEDSEDFEDEDSEDFETEDDEDSEDLEDADAESSEDEDEEMIDAVSEDEDDEVFDDSIDSTEEDEDFSVSADEPDEEPIVPTSVQVPISEPQIQVKTRSSVLTRKVHEPVAEQVVASPSQIDRVQEVKETKGSDTLNSRKVSESLDLETSFINKSKVKDTKPKVSTGDREITKVPRDLVDFLRLYPRTQYKVAVQYFGEKEVKRQIRMGKVFRNGKYLVI